MDYKLATLQLINGTWTYSTRKSSKPSKIFGKETNAGFTYSTFLPGQPASPSSDNLIHTIWLNDITDQDAQLYREEYGQQAYIVIDPSKPEDKRCILTSSRLTLMKRSSLPLLRNPPHFPHSSTIQQGYLQYAGSLAYYTLAHVKHKELY